MTSWAQRSGSSSNRKWRTPSSSTSFEPGISRRETRGVVEREVLVRWPHRTSVGTPRAASFRLVGLELVEVEGAVELEHAAAVLRRGERLPVLVQRVLVERIGGLLEQRPERLAREAVHERLALDRGLHRLGDLDPLMVGEESRIRDHQAADGIGVIACPAEADQAAGVVDDQHDPVEPDLAAEAFDRLDTPFEGPGRIGR